MPNLLDISKPCTYYLFLYDVPHQYIVFSFSILLAYCELSITSSLVNSSSLFDLIWDVRLGSGVLRVTGEFGKLLFLAGDKRLASYLGPSIKMLLQITLVSLTSYYIKYV